MSARRIQARYQDPSVSFKLGTRHITIRNESCYTPKSRLYSIKKRIVDGKIILPEQTGVYDCYKVLTNGEVIVEDYKA